CIMCGADRSSTIRARRLGLPPLPDRYPDQFFEEIGEFIEHASICDFVGGEPLLVRGHWRIWDIMREVAPGIDCAITTNGTIWNPRVEALLHDFPTSVRLSMDGVTRETFEAVRVGADYDRFMANFDRFYAYSRASGRELTLSWSFIQQNWWELADAMVWAEEHGVVVYVTTVLDRGFGVQHLPDDELRVVHERMLQQSDAIRPSLQLNRENWDRQVTMVSAELEARTTGIRIDPSVEPPTPDAPQRTEQAILAQVAHLDPLPGSPDLRTFLAGWELDLRGADVLRCDPSGLVVAHQRGEPSIVRGIQLGTDQIADVLARLCDQLDGHLWRMEEIHLVDAFVATVAIGAEVRDGDPVVMVRLVATRVGDQIELCLSVDGRSAQATDVPVVITAVAASSGG
ncbi:MAG TPA: radical SAM protein, partial [Acidimicrobiales bacterium]|nr:radical SAM protein [Acidimicrobiales bacterium]